MTAASDGAGSGSGRVLGWSVLDGVWIGGGAGLVYGLVVGIWGSAGQGASWSGFLGVTVLADLVAVPTGVVLGAVFGVGFGLAAVAGLRHLAWLEAAVVAVFGALVVTLAIAGMGGVNSGLLAWTGGPLLAGVPAAALHGWRTQRRTGR